MAALKDVPISYGPVTLLVFSFLWPVGSYWGQQTIQQQASYITYKDPLQRPIGIFKTWFWMALNGVFAAYTCNERLSPSFHKHASQSALVIYIFSRFFQSIWLDLVFPMSATGYGIIDTFWLCYVLTILSCITLYFVLNGNKFTRAMFGIQ